MFYMFKYNLHTDTYKTVTKIGPVTPNTEFLRDTPMSISDYWRGQEGNLPHLEIGK